MINSRKLLQEHNILPIDTWKTLKISYMGYSKIDIKDKLFHFSNNICGLYIYKDCGTGEVLYVGKAKNVYSRLFSHYQEYLKKPKWDLQGLYHKFFSMYSTITIHYLHVASESDRSLFEIMLHEVLKPKFITFCEAEKNVITKYIRLELRISPEFKKTVNSFCLGMNVGCSDLLKKAVEFNALFPKFRENFIFTYMKDASVFNLLEDFLKNESKKNQHTIREYLSIFESSVKKLPVFKFLKLSTIMPQSNGTEIKKKKDRGTERIGFIVDAHTNCTIQKNCLGNKSKFLRTLLNDYMQSKDFFNAINCPEFKEILPPSLKNTFEECCLNISYKAMD